MSMTKGPHRGSPRRVEAQARLEKMMKLRRSGASYHEIAQLVGITYDGVRKAIRAELDRTAERIAEDGDAVRQLELERLDRLQSAVWRRATDMNNPDYRAIDRVLRIMERRAALMGLDQRNIGIVAGAGNEVEFSVNVFQRALEQKPPVDDEMDDALYQTHPVQ